MNDFIFTQCPNCQTKYQVSLDVVSAGKFKAKCGHCKTSFIIKDNMVSRSFLEEANLSSFKPVIESTQSNNTGYRTDSEPSKEQSSNYSLNNLSLENLDKLSFADDNLLSEDFGKEWSIPVEELQSEDKLYDLSNFDKALTAEENNDEPWTILPDNVDLNGAPPYYVSTNSNLAMPFNHRSFIPVISGFTIKKTSKHKKIAPYITTGIWFMGCLFLSLLLFAQYTFFHLKDLVKNPSYRHGLQAFCDVLTCAIPNADINQISIVHQAHASSTVRYHCTDISASLINNSHEDQVFPNIEVKIYGSNGIIADFVALPEEYLISPQHILGQSQLTAFKLTVPIENNTINEIEIKPFY